MINYTSDLPSRERVSDEHLAINSCGIEHSFKIDRGSRRPNGRVDYHILYIERGFCYLENGERSTPVGAGSIIIFRPGEPQHYHFLADDNTISHYIHFTGTGCAELLKKLGIYDIKVFEMGRSAVYEEISSKMVREYTVKRPFWENYTVGCLFELLTLIARKHSLRLESVSPESEQRISLALRKIYDNISDPPTLAELAAEANLSVSRFSHLFREVVKKSPKEYMISLRIDRACELMENGQMSINEIAESIGFFDQSYFSRIFKKRIGATPMEYRKRTEHNRFGETDLSDTAVGFRGQ